MNILVITGEQREGKWNPASFETLFAAQQIAAETQSRLAAVVIGKGVCARSPRSWRRISSPRVLLVEHDLLERYTPDGFTITLGQAIAQAKPDLVLLPHTYQVRDFAPKLAASLGKGPDKGNGMIGDCIAYRYENGRLIFVRQMSQGKTVADVTFLGAAPWFASFQAGAFRGDQVARGASPAPISAVTVDLKPEQIRTKPLELFREAKQAVDLTQAPILVSIGRGIKAPENIPMAEKLAKLLGGELAAVARGPSATKAGCPWIARSAVRGQTVAPKLYLALGISGAIQHVVGMKGSRTIVAINKDQNAPIFDVADYGIVGDIFELIPALTEALEKK